MQAKKSGEEVFYIPASAMRSRKVVHVLQAGKLVSFSTNKTQKARAGLCVSDLLSGKEHLALYGCTIMVTVFRGNGSVPFDGGYLHVMRNEVILEGLHEVFHKTSKMRLFDYFQAKCFRIGDRIEFDVGDCLKGCLEAFRRAQFLDQAAA